MSALLAGLAMGIAIGLFVAFQIVAAQDAKFRREDERRADERRRAYELRSAVGAAVYAVNYGRGAIDTKRLGEANASAVLALQAELNALEKKWN